MKKKTALLSLLALQLLFSCSPRSSLVEISNGISTLSQLSSFPNENPLSSGSYSMSLYSYIYSDEEMEKEVSRKSGVFTFSDTSAYSLSYAYDDDGTKSVSDLFYSGDTLRIKDASGERDFSSTADSFFSTFISFKERLSSISVSFASISHDYLYNVYNKISNPLASYNLLSYGSGSLEVHLKGSHLGYDEFFYVDSSKINGLIDEIKITFSENRISNVVANYQYEVDSLTRYGAMNLSINYR